jgi:hypothetical protein
MASKREGSALPGKAEGRPPGSLHHTVFNMACSSVMSSSITGVSSGHRIIWFLDWPTVAACFGLFVYHLEEKCLFRWGLRTGIFRSEVLFSFNTQFSNTTCHFPLCRRK